VDLHVPTAVLYLAAAVAATAGLALPAPRVGRAALALLAAGALLHGLAFWELHGRSEPPSLTELPAAVSLMAWLGTLFSLAILWRPRLTALTALVASAAFLGTSFAALVLGGPPAPSTPSPAWSHAHVLLASAGFALLGVAGAAGLLFVLQHRRLKARRASAHGTARMALPSLESLDRVNAFALSLGFLLLTLGLVSGVLWVEAAEGRLWPGSPHAWATLLAWCIYAALVAGRFALRQGPRASALCAALGFAVLLVAVVGVGVLA
jgi:ABC-type transport system involved in cytochrome c biogenesis permease subunit